MCQIPVRALQFWVRLWHRRIISHQHVQNAGRCVCPTCLQSSSRVTPKCGIQAMASAGAILEGHSELCVVQYWLHSANHADQQQARWPGGMVTGDFQTLPEGRSRLRQHSRTFCSDQGPPRKSRKKLQVIICVLLVELCERFTFFGIVCNMILFCTVKLGYGNYLAAAVNLCFVGASTLTPVLVGWFAETCLGRTKVLYLCAFLHFFGKTLWAKGWHMLSDVMKFWTIFFIMLFKKNLFLCIFSLSQLL